MSEKYRPAVHFSFQEVEFPLGDYLVLEALVEGDGETPPTGNICFQSATEVLGNSTIDDEGTAKLSYSGFRSGTHDIKAVYSGDDTYSGEESEAVPYTPSKPTLEPAEKSGWVAKLGGSKPYVPPPEVIAYEFEVNLNVFDLATSLPDSRQNLEYLTKMRTINVPGVGQVRHGERFTLRGRAGEVVLRGYGEHLRLVGKTSVPG